MKKKTCCFSGHRYLAREESLKVQNILENEIIRLINKGVIYYVSGGALGFDTLASLTVLKLKEIYPEIQLNLILPCKNQTKSWRRKDISLYEYILDKADKVFYISNLYFNGCMQKRNRCLVDNSDFLVCYLLKDKGGTAYTVNYAAKSEINIINIAFND